MELFVFILFFLESIISNDSPLNKNNFQRKATTLKQTIACKFYASKLGKKHVLALGMPPFNKIGEKTPGFRNKSNYIHCKIHM
jgi:hypothetical protein